MGLFKRKNKDVVADEPPKDKVKWSKRPANTAFKQQRLKAWQPILTPKAVLPTLFIIGLIFAPIGALIIWGSGKVTNFTLDYTECDAQPGDGSWAEMPKSKWDYELKTGAPVTKSSIKAPQWAFTSNPSGAVGERSQCRIQFDVPYDLGPGVFMYYKLTNYYQNHRRYVNSFDSDQLLGRHRSAGSLDGGNCKPITSHDGKAYYPCGLIANSFFNDTYSKNLVLLNARDGQSNATYSFTDENIAWHGIAKQYVKVPYIPNDDPTQLLPPPNWAERFPNGYQTLEDIPDLEQDEHFQIWMRVAALPTFRKLWMRNDGDIMTAGTYEITINMNYPVKQFSGTKSVVISTVSWIGGKQPFLGWAYVAAAILCVVLALAGLVRHLIKPRKLGDMTLLSWNQPQAQR